MSAGSASDVRAEDRASQIRRVVSEYARRRAAGEPVCSASIVAEHTKLMPDLAAELAKLDRIEGALDEAASAGYERALERLEAEWRGGSAAPAVEQPPDLFGGSASASTVEKPSGGSEQQLAAGISTPARIGRYRVRHLLGEGAFGRVYLAWDEQLDREVAVKVSQPYQVDGPEGVEGFLAEARTLARLDHPSIVPVYDVGRTGDNCCYVVSKWIRGSDLQLRMRQERLGEEEAVRIVAAVAGALDYAHQRGLVHRDVKPANILIDASGHPYLGDFGLALSGRKLGEGRSFAGTPAYMSPEQARGEAHRVDGRSDVFSLGVVLYELLTGRKPFCSESHEELLRQILWEDPLPPRQCNPSLRPELERICLKALSKRAAERYRTAGELADDLRHCLGASARLGGLASPSTGGGPLVLVKSTAEPPPPRIVPRGLRPFDASDSASYLALVPGPRDRDGLPESIRQWKLRIEENDPEESFPVGVLYGPSGCGKSSLVRAGLLPRLSPHVHRLYVEAAAEHTEARLLRKLLRRYPELPADGELVDCLAALRRGCGPAGGAKLLLVIDQFEQWLHGRGEADRRLLVEALRQCDGARLECLLLVRDDFWLALSRFMTELEVDLVQRHNSALVDLFDPAHARKVLAEFGRAFGRLPEDLRRLNPSQEAFLERAIAGLTDGDKVVPVRLALFAEMVKGKPWSPGTLRDVGGPAGVGVTFLEETFSAQTANPQHRLHEPAARAVLEALLPEAGSDMKGRLRSYPELLDLSGYGEKPRAFKELMRILDAETRLITPGDPEVTGVEAAFGALGGRYYQLTHDYLVPALRQWLTKKRKSTRAGRSELRLASRAAMWSATGERRQLPSLWEWVSICLLTRSDLWSEPQRKMMRAATRQHVLTAGGLALIVLVFLFGGLELTGMARDLLMQLRARSAVVWMAIGNEEAVWPLLRNAPDPTLRTRVVHGLSPLVVDSETLLERAAEQEDASIRHAMLLLAGELLGDPAGRFDVRAGLEDGSLSADAADRLLELYRDDPDPGVHAAAEWTLRRHAQSDRLARAARELASAGTRGDRQWYINGQDHTMIIVPGGAQFLMGPAEGADPSGAQQPHYERIRRTFSIAAAETTLEQFRRFLEENPRASSERENVARSGGLPAGVSGRFLPLGGENTNWAGFPQTSVTWYEAAAYCNWLSKAEGLPPDQWCYLPNGRGEYAAGMSVAADYLDRRGYRLPTQAEWEYACRAGAATAYSFGSDPSYLKHYAVYADVLRSHPEPVGTRKPNDFGLFDVHGNVAEWCQDRFLPYEDRLGPGKTQPDRQGPAVDSESRVVRGGAYSSPADSVRSAAVDKQLPNERRGEIGFRVARSYP